MEKTATHVFPSDLGWMAIAWKANCVTRFTFGQPSAAAALADLGAEGNGNVAADDLPAWVAELVSRLQAYAAGGDESFGDVPVALDHLSEFQKRVVRACRSIRRGKVRMYGELAAAAGSPGAARAVGNVMAQNRYPILVPCHRVVGSAGSLGGFSARDGISMKRRMLELEGAATGLPKLQPRPRQRVLAGA
jgi:methylated-DNA-[protein]-cysteine S-methyltransferase